MVEARGKIGEEEVSKAKVRLNTMPKKLDEGINKVKRMRALGLHS